MKLPQVVIHESDSALERLLRPLTQERRWSLRRVRGAAACLNRLARGVPTVLVLKLGPNPAAELALLERVRWLYPEVRSVVVGDVQDPALGGVAWDLGASYVLFSPQPRALLPQVTAGLMESVLESAPVRANARRPAPGR